MFSASRHVCGCHVSAIEAQHPVSDACSLSLAIMGITSEADDQEWKISNMFHIYNLSSGTLRLDWEQINNIMTPHSRGFFGQNIVCDKPRIGSHPDHSGMQIG